MNELQVGIQMNGHGPWAYLKDVVTQLSTQANSRINDAFAALLAVHRFIAPIFRGAMRQDGMARRLSRKLVAPNRGVLRKRIPATA